MTFSDYAPGGIPGKRGRVKALATALGQEIRQQHQQQQQLQQQGIRQSQQQMYASGATDPVAVKMGAMAPFGITTAGAGLSDEGLLTSTSDALEIEMSSDSFVIKVLNLVDNVCQMPEARRRLVASYKSLFAIVQRGSPRARVVVMRILRKLLVTPEAPAPAELDVIFTQALNPTAQNIVTGNLRLACCELICNF